MAKPMPLTTHGSSDGTHGPGTRDLVAAWVGPGTIKKQYPIGIVICYVQLQPCVPRLEEAMPPASLEEGVRPPGRPGAAGKVDIYMCICMCIEREIIV